MITASGIFKQNNTILIHSSVNHATQNLEGDKHPEIFVITGLSA